MPCLLVYMWEPCDCVVDANHQDDLVKGLSPPVNVRPTRLLISQHRHAGATPDHRPAAMWEPGVEHVAGGFARIAFYVIRMRCRCVWAPQELYFLIR